VCCSRKGSVRVSTYFFKFFARERFVPSHIEVKPCIGYGGWTGVQEYYVEAFSPGNAAWCWDCLLPGLLWLLLHAYSGTFCDPQFHLQPMHHPAAWQLPL
jgi:hypothetical protein